MGGITSQEKTHASIGAVNRIPAFMEETVRRFVIPMMLDLIVLVLQVTLESAARSGVMEVARKFFKWASHSLAPITFVME